MFRRPSGDPQLTNARYIHLQEEYIKDEQRSLKRELVRAQEEIKRIQSVPLVIGQFMEAIDQKYVPTSHAHCFTIDTRSLLCPAPVSYSHQQAPTM